MKIKKCGRGGANINKFYNLSFGLEDVAFGLTTRPVRSLIKSIHISSAKVSLDACLLLLTCNLIEIFPLIRLSFT